VAPQTFDAAVAASRVALASMAKGDPRPTVELWSPREDVVLANPLGPPIVGHTMVVAETARVASMFIDGTPPTFDEIARWASDDLGCVLSIEHARVQRHGSDDTVPLDLRVTTVFRREEDGWHLCLRHADRVTASPQPNQPA
jgi:ketosteroid isomerase-like protein